MKEKKRRIGAEEIATKDASLRLSKADLDALVKDAFSNNTFIEIDGLKEYSKDVLREKARELQVSAASL